LLCEECAADPSAVVSDSPEEVDDLHRSRYAPGVTVAPPPETKRERGVRFYRRGWWDYTHTLYRPQTNDKELWSDYNAGWSASMQANAAMRAVGAR
jgi:hypothetical protein